MKHNHRHWSGPVYCSIICCICVLVLFILVTEMILIFGVESPSIRVNIRNRNTRVNASNLNTSVKLRTSNTSVNVNNLDTMKSNYTNEQFLKWNQSLCSHRSTLRGPHQKVIGISVYGTTSNFTDNPMYSWDTHIIQFLVPLTDEVKLLLPSWIIRLYIDFTGSTKTQRDRLYSFSNVDVCDMKDIPLFGSSIFTYLPGKFWRFLPIFDPYVDYYLSRDLDSPMTQREVDTIDIWLREKSKTRFFYIARDHNQHNTPILGGLWGAATTKARKDLFVMFEPMLVPSVVSRYKGAGDQDYLTNFVWPKIINSSSIFDSYSCAEYGGQSFPTERPKGECFLGCIRPCCTNRTINAPRNPSKPCPLSCRPKDHQDWTYC